MYNTEPYVWANFKSIFQNLGYFDHWASKTDKNYSICGISGGLHSGTIPVYYVAKFGKYAPNLPIPLYFVPNNLQIYLGCQLDPPTAFYCFDFLVIAVVAISSHSSLIDRNVHFVCCLKNICCLSL